METLFFFFLFYSEEVADSGELGRADAINELIPIHHTSYLWLVVPHPHATPRITALFC